MGRTGRGYEEEGKLPPAKAWRAAGTTAYDAMRVVIIIDVIIATTPARPRRRNASCPGASGIRSAE